MKNKKINSFFKSIGDDIKNGFKKHILKIIGYLIMFIVPIVILFTMYLEKKPEHWQLPVFVCIPLIVLVLVYYFKLRTHFAVKIERMTIENSQEQGKHAGLIIIAKILEILMAIIPFIACYILFNEISKTAIQIKNIFLMIAICEAVGGLFVIFDTIKNITFEET